MYGSRNDETTFLKKAKLNIKTANTELVKIYILNTINDQITDELLKSRDYTRINEMNVSVDPMLI